MPDPALPRLLACRPASALRAPAGSSDTPAARRLTVRRRGTGGGAAAGKAGAGRGGDRWRSAPEGRRRGRCVVRCWRVAPAVLVNRPAPSQELLGFSYLYVLQCAVLRGGGPACPPSPVSYHPEACRAGRNCSVSQQAWGSSDPFQEPPGCRAAALSAR